VTVALMSTPASMPPSSSGLGPKIKRFAPLIRDVAINILVPWLVYAGLEKLFPAPSLIPLIVAAAIPAVEFAVMFSKKRRFDAIALLSVSQYLVALALTLLSHSPRQSMWLHAWQPASLGLVFALSCLVGRPLTVPLARQAMTGGDPEKLARFDVGSKLPGMRVHFYLIAALWAVGLCAETVVRLIVLEHVSVRDYLLVANVLGYVTPTVLTWASLRYGAMIGRRHPDQA
jgi:hypothetical protein